MIPHVSASKCEYRHLAIYGLESLSSLNLIYESFGCQRSREMIIDLSDKSWRKSRNHMQHADTR